MMTGRGARARLHDVERAGEVGQMALRLTQRAGDAGQRKGEHAPPEGAHEVVVETVAALVVPAVRVREHFIERTLVDEREDARARAGTMSASVVTAWPSISISVRWSTGLLSATAQTMGDAYQRQRVESAVLEQGTADGLTAIRRRFGRHGFVEAGLCRESVLHVDEQRVVELGIDGRKHRLERVRAVERGVTVVIAGEAQQVDEAPHDRLERRGEVGEQARHLHQAPSSCTTI